ncbi:unnamed protein product [Caenorhabditis bovis]|uniref:Uncharacterized protein n=1 Tax=Caenorhabditis bovis TaxID=2654633 RepID=A0A8S1F018_9PELO|nr:unnamed protein product [Caenorhabditis bovis]
MIRQLLFLFISFTSCVVDARNCYECAPIVTQLSESCACGRLTVGSAWNIDDKYFSQARNSSCGGQLICNAAPKMYVASHIRINSYFSADNHRWEYKESTCQDFWADFGVQCDRRTLQYMITRIPVNKVTYIKTGDIPRFKLPVQLTYATCND